MSPSVDEPARVPVTILTGYLGAGKTSLILNLVSQLPPAAAYRTVWLKNEFGDAGVDALLASSAGLKSKEVVNGCLCCFAVGYLPDCLAELLSDTNSPPPDRVIVETSGSAYPAALALQVRKAEADLPVVLDGVVTVVDCLNFTKYPDKSRAAKLQAQYTDLILLNKVDLLGHGAVAEAKLDLVIDEIVDLNPDTPRVVLGPSASVPMDLVFGLDTKSAQWLLTDSPAATSATPPTPDNHMQAEVDLLQYGPDPDMTCTEDALKALEKAVQTDRVFRAKGSVRDAADDAKILVFNCVGGRARIHRIPSTDAQGSARFVFMGNGLRKLARVLAPPLGINGDSALWRFTPRTCRTPTALAK